MSKTGDEAEMDLIIRGGENIHPLEIENCLLSHPKIADVSVVGLPDSHYGEAVAAFVVIAKYRQHHESQIKRIAQDWVRKRLSSHLGISLRF